MATHKSRFVGPIVLAGAGFIIHRTNPVLPDETVALDDGTYFIDELLLELETKVQAEGGGSLDGFFAERDPDTGICYIGLGPGEEGDLHWTLGAGATEVRDWLRLTGATASLTDTPSIVNGTLGDRTHAFGLYLERCLMTDREEETPQGTQGRADDGSIQTITGTKLLDHFVRFKFNGFPRKSGAAGEYEAFLDFLDRASTGTRFRHYPDRTVTTPWVRLTNPYGYKTYILARDSWGWRPEPSRGNYYARFISPELQMHQYV